MLPTLRMLQPKVFQEALQSNPSPDTSPAVVTSSNGQVRVATFKGSGTWTKSSNQSFVIVFAWNGGCGGGSGGRSLTGGAGNNFQGGGGGAPGNAMMLMLPSYYFGTSTTITVGSGGAGGASQTTPGGLGNAGSVGGSTSIGSITIPQTGTGGGGGIGTGGSGFAGIGGSGGMNTYIMSGGYTIPSGQQTGGTASTSSSYSTLAYVPDYTIIGSGTIRMPCMPFMVSTGGGGSVFGAQIHTTPTPGGDINLFGNPITIGGQGVANTPVGTLFNNVIATNGTYFAYPYGGIANNNQAMMFVTGGTGGGGAGDNAVTGGHPLNTQAGGNGGIGAGGGGGSGASANGATTFSGPGGNGGPGLVIIYEFL